MYHVGGYDKIRHVMLHFSAGSGFFYTVDGDITLNQAFLDEVKAYMHEQVEKAVPIYKRSVDTHEARERFRLHGMTDKDRLFRYRRVSRVNLYSLGDFEDYYYGFMTYDTSYLKYFDLYLYDDGFVLQMPEKKAPETVPAANLSPKVFQVQRESERWGEQMGISTVADLNERITKGNIQQMMLIAEALQEQKIAKIAEQIAERIRRSKGIPWPARAVPPLSWNVLQLCCAHCCPLTSSASARPDKWTQVPGSSDTPMKTCLAIPAWM